MVNRIISAELACAGLKTFTITDAVTNTTTDVLTVAHNSSGTPTASFGTRLLFKLKSSNTNDRDAVALSTFWTVATDGSRDSAFTVSTVGAAGSLTERLRAHKDGVTVGHLLTTGTTPTASLGSAAGADATVTISGTDTAGAVNVTFSSNSPSGSAWVTVSFAQSYTAAPVVIFSAASDGAAQSLSRFWVSTSTSSFTINIAAGSVSFVNATVYSLSYVVVSRGAYAARLLPVPPSLVGHSQAIYPY